MKHTVELKALEMNRRLYVCMNVYTEKDLVPRWSRTIPLYKVTTEYIMNIYYEFYMYLPLLICAQSKLDDCKKQMSRWIARYKKNYDIKGIFTWSYELEY